MKISAGMIVAFAFLGAVQDSNDPLQTQAKQALDATGLSYQKTTSGKSYSIVFDHPNNRRQTVYMSVSPSKTNGLVTYTLYTQVWYSEKAPDEELMKKVFTKVKKLGAFYLFKDSKDVWAFRFGVKLDATEMPANPSASDALVTSLKDAIYFANAVGEETDLELNGDKDIR